MLSGFVSRCLVAAAVWLAGAAAARGQVVISEIHYDPAGGATNEFVELFNAGTNAVALGNWQLSAGVTYLFANPTTLGAGGYLVVCANRDGFFARFPSVTNVASGAFSGSLNNGGEQLTLVNAATQVVFDVTFDNVAPWPLAAAGLGSSLVLLDVFGSPTNPANWGASAEVHGNPGTAGALFVRDIVINEVLAHTDPPQEDAIELMNVTTQAVDVSGWFLSDDNATRKKYVFPTGSVVAAGAYIVVYQEQLTNSAGALIPFDISSKGDEVFLSQGNTNGDVTRFVDDVSFNASKNGVSFGLFPNGGGDFIPLAGPTFGVANPASLEDFRAGTGAANVGPYVHPVVINEIMYNAETSATVTVASEFVELVNASGSPVDLYNVDYPEFTWSLSGGIGFVFPTNMTMAPGQIIVVCATNNIAGFRTSYNVPTNVIVLGPWTGNLNNAGDELRIRVPNSPEPPSNIAARYVADEVKFDDDLPWPLAADGYGGSLERIDATAWGDTPDNWHAAPNVATPGRTNTAFVPPGSIVISEIMAVNRHTLTDEEGDYSDWIELYNTRSFPVSLTGWHLTDDSSLPAKWTFPAVTIPAHGYLIVFADLKDRTNDVTKLHTNFSLDEGGEFLGLYRSDLVEEFVMDPFPAQYADVGYGFAAFGNEQPVPVKEMSAAMYIVPTNATMLATNWNEQGFDEAGWLPGTNGFGFDTAPDFQPLITTDVRTQMFNLASSLFARFPVGLTNAGSYAQMSLRIKFEDGFMAWMNGVPMVSNNVPAANAWNGSAPAGRNESLAVQFTTYDLTPYLYLLNNGTNVFAVQGLNNGAASSDFLLIPELTLISSGGSTTGVGQVSGYLYPATPGNANPTSQPGVVATPVLSHPGGVFAGSVSVTVTCATAGATLRYTLDGSEPTEASSIYSTPIVITEDTELRVRAFAEGKIPSTGKGAVYRITFLGINEFLASNAMASPDIADFSAFPDFIELFNAGTSAVSLAGYHLSDSIEAPFKWKFPPGAVIPAGGYLHVWADGEDSRPGIQLTRGYWPFASYVTRYYHSNFRLGSLGESACLFSPAGSLIDSITFGPQSTDVSHGRLPDGSTNWVYLGHPSAGTNNIGPGLSHNLYKSPEVTIGPVDGQLYITNVVNFITLSSETNVTEIRYTTNGGIPTSTSTLYTGSIVLTTSGVIRARAYAPDLLPGPIATRTFIRDTRRPDLPVLALVLDPQLAFAPVTGIYSNNYKEREVPGYIQYYTTPTNKGFEINAGFRLYSYNTFLKAQKPFTVYIKSDFGDETLDYKLFAERPVGSFDRFILRNGNDDWEEAFLRDTLGQKIIRRATDTATQDFIPCATFLNGTYYGLINIQEKMDEMYCVKNYGVRLEDVDFYENDGTSSSIWILTAGTEDAWNHLQSFLTNSLANSNNYAYVKSIVDIEDVVDYVAAQTFLYDTSWAHNRKWWRDRNPGGKWRWCVTDLDRAMLVANANVNNFSSTFDPLTTRVHVFPQLLANGEFRAYAAQRIMAHLSSSYSTNRTLPLIDAEAQRINAEIGQHIAKYSTQAGIPSYGFWSNEIASIRSFAIQRPSSMLTNVANYFSTGQLARVTVDITGGAGRALANYVTLNTNSITTLAAGLPVTMTATPDVGQQFVRWDVATNITTTLIATGSVWRYFDSVTNTITDWQATNFNDTTWSNGPGQLGYGDGDEATTISYGGDATNKHITTYFRRELVLTNPAVLTNIQAGIIRDDGVVVYVNGTEVHRNNMPAGFITNTTLASANITQGGGESTYYFFNLTNTVFKTGTNIIAVEIHQFVNDSADTGFDLSLTATAPGGFAPTTNAATFVWRPRNGESLRAVFAPASLNLIPSTIASNTTLGSGPWYATGDIFVPSNTTLNVSPGVEILMPERADIRVEGQLLINGTTSAPVRIGPNTNAGAAILRFNTDPLIAGTNNAKILWGGLSFHWSTHTGELHNLVIRDATLSKFDPVNHKSAISALGSDLFMDRLDLDDVRFPLFVRFGNSTVLQNSRIDIGLTGDGINLKKTQYARIENCEFIGPPTAPDTDGIDYDGINGGIIRGCYIHDFIGPNNDAVDIGEEAVGIIIESNIFERITDKSTSVGQGSTVLYRHNITRDCTLGLGIKDAGSHALIEHNTFHKCENPVAIYEKNRGDGGGTATIRNNIFSESTLEPVAVDTYSTATVAYCLSDTLPVSGIGNLLAQPQFLNASTNNFNLQHGSAAIDAGDPAYPLDPDGTRPDIGARPFDWRAGHVMISEIHYHPSNTAAQTEYIELHNPGGTNLDLTGYRFTKGVQLTFPSGTILTNGSYLVIAATTNGLTGIAPIILWTNGTLDNAGETIELHDTASNELDRVAYEAFNPWPSLPDGQGPSLSIINPRRDNSLPGNWYASAATNGTPGQPFDNQFPGPITFGRGTTNHFTLTFDGLQNLLYTLEFTPNLLPASWTPTASATIDASNRITFATSPTNTPGIYRIRSDAP